MRTTGLYTTTLLSEWWDPAAQGLLKRLGMEKRQIRAWGSTSNVTLHGKDADGNPVVYLNKNRLKLMGDTPEFMPLDRHLFNDLKLAAKRNVSMTRSLPHTDERKFWFNTPKRAFRTMCRTWEYAPSNARVVEDVEECLVSIDMVVAS
jgi:hypothetical protein